MEQLHLFIIAPLINITSGKFFDLNFTVLNGTSGSAAITWSDNPTPQI